MGQWQVKGFVLSVLFCLSGSLSAETVYRWVDENGGVHFGDEPPENKDMNAQVLRFAKPPSLDSRGQNDYYSVTNQARRLEEQRLAREQALAEKRRLQAERRWLEEQQTAEPSPQPPVTGVNTHIQEIIPPIAPSGRGVAIRPTPHRGLRAGLIPGIHEQGFIRVDICRCKAVAISGKRGSKCSFHHREQHDNGRECSFREGRCCQATCRL